MSKYPEKAGQKTLDANRQVQALVFGPLLFQAARVLRDRGLLKALARSHPTGLTTSELAETTQTSLYGVTVLVEAGLAGGLVEKDGECFRITRAGYLLDADEMARVNMNFVQDVCYRAAEYLPEAIEKATPAGLVEFGTWPTVYEGLSELGEPARKSWLEFDHFYSDDSFPRVLAEVLSSKPSRLLDVGGNTGKFAQMVLTNSSDLHVTVADLPGQIRACRENLEQASLSARASFWEVSLLSAEAVLPIGADVIWMSQFLCCFSEPEVVHVLKLAKAAMTPGTRLLILDNFWDCQENAVAELILQATSLYFTTVANGTSRMYDSKTLLTLIERAGLVVRKQTHGIGCGHSIIECSLDH